MSNAMERKIWKPAINILKEMAPEKDEHLTLIFILFNFQTCLFYELQFGWTSPKILLSDSILETGKTSGKRVKFAGPAVLFQSVNYCRLWTIIVWHFWQL